MSFLDWPVPPPFMWCCHGCTDLLDMAPGAESADERDAYTDCLLRLQLALARHLVREHASEIPEPHTDDCELCERYAINEPEDELKVWAEHRARDLFLPADLARLL